ncbi:S8 family serine peptidase [Actinomadura viridis]
MPIAVAVAVVSLGPAVPAASGAPNPPAKPLAGGEPGRRTVTLVTGDRVHLRTERGGPQSVQVEPGAGRKGVSFVRRARGNELSIVPSDAAPLVMSGRLDPALFNVTRMVRDGYDDARRGDLPLIVAGMAGTGLPELGGARVARGLPALNGAALTQRKDRAGAFWTSLTSGRSTFPRGVKRVWLDARVRATLDESVPRIGAPAAWQAGHTGKGVTVGVLDTGIDAGHPDLAGSVAAARDFTGSATGTKDGHGHGTHVASIITGDGVADGKYRGVAPDARLVVGKVLDDTGQGSLSQVIAGMEWAAAQRPRVVNMSLGVDIPSDGSDPLSTAVDSLTAATGTLFVIAAGNAGGERTVSVPAVAESALTVGAVDGGDRLAEFSSSGPRYGDGAIKPDITAPGVGIAAARAEGTEMGEPVGDRYTRADGTSMAAPHVAGAAALLAERHAGWAPARLKAALMNTARPSADDSVYRQGAGRVDVGRAVAQRVWAEEGSLSFRLRGDTVAKGVTFRNESGSAVTLDLAVSAKGPDGGSADLFTVSPARVQIPAGGTASAMVTADPAANPAGAYSGGLTAKSADGAHELRLPVGAQREPALHRVKVSGIDRTGKPVGGRLESLPSVGVVDLRTGEYMPTYVSAGSIVAEVPSGRYEVTAAVNTVTADGTLKDSTLFSHPVLDVGRDMDITVDARRGRRAAVQLDSPTATQSGFDEIGVVETVADVPHDFYVGTYDPAVGLYAVGAPEVKDRPYDFYFMAQRVEPQGPRAYHLALFTRRRIPAEPRYRVQDAQLAVLDSRYHADRPFSGQRVTYVELPNHPLYAYGIGQFPVTAPGRRTELYSVAPGVTWRRYLETSYFSERAVNPPMKAGQKTVHAWSSAALGSSPQTARKSPTSRMQFGFEAFAPVSAEVQNVDPESGVVTARTALYRNGVLLGSADTDAVFVDTPPGRASYSLHATASRQAPWTGLGTRVDTRWTFPYTPEFTTMEQAPLVSLRTSGAFDETNRAPGGEPFRLDIRATENRDHDLTPPLPTMRTLTVEVSYDEGATWQPAKVTATAENRWQADVVHPERHDGHVSLRLRAGDGEGNSLDHTMIRAYGLR